MRAATGSSGAAALKMQIKGTHGCYDGIYLKFAWVLKMQIKGTYGCYDGINLSLQGWRTRAQLLVMYNGNVELVDKIVQAKRSLGQGRPHPDLPDDQDAMLYLAT